MAIGGVHCFTALFFNRRSASEGTHSPVPEIDAKQTPEVVMHRLSPPYLRFSASITHNVYFVNMLYKFYGYT